MNTITDTIQIKNNQVRIFLALLLMSAFLLVPLAAGAVEGLTEATVQSGSPTNLLEALEKTEKKSNAISDMQASLKNPLLKEAKEGNLPWLRSILSFLFVSSLIILIAYFLNGRMKGGVKGLLTSTKSVRLLQTVNVGLKKQVAILDYEGTRLVVGISGNGMQLLYSKDQGNKVSEPVVEKIQETHETIQASANQAYQNAARLASKPVKTPADEGFAGKIREAITAMKPLHGSTLPSQPSSSFKEGNFFKRQESNAGQSDDSAVIYYSSNSGFQTTGR